MASSNLNPMTNLGQSKDKEDLQRAATKWKRNFSSFSF